MSAIRTLQPFDRRRRAKDRVMPRVLDQRERCVL